jgi:hypothetical protein
VNEDLADKYEEAILETLGFPGRMISASKTGFVKQHPTHMPVFNANVCLNDGKIWWGDLDLTVDEPKLVEFAALIGETVYVLSELSARFTNEARPLLEEALYLATPAADNWFDERTIERANDGTLRRRKPRCSGQSRVPPGH